MIDPDAALDYLGFVAARHEAWSARQLGSPQPWTDEPIVATRKFTNVFRVLDYGSQYVLTDLAPGAPTERDLLMRLFLYRHTGRVEVWQHLDLTVGMPTVAELEDVFEVWDAYRAHKRSVFTNAYLVFPQSTVPGSDKLRSIVELTRRLFDPASPDECVTDFLRASSQAERFAALRRNKGVADFMSMQILTDWGYTEAADRDREHEFVVPGPGAVKGAKALDPDARPVDVIVWAQRAIEAMPDPPVIETPSGALRLPSCMDTQNTLCEFSKYVRYASKPLPAKPYVPAHPGKQDPPVLPKHW